MPATENAEPRDEPRNRHERRALAAKDRLAYTINEFSRGHRSSGRTTVYGEIRSGKLKAKKLRGRTVILAPDAHDYLAALPDMDVAA